MLFSCEVVQKYKDMLVIWNVTVLASASIHQQSTTKFDETLGRKFYFISWYSGKSPWQVGPRERPTSADTDSGPATVSLLRVKQ